MLNDKTSFKVKGRFKITTIKESQSISNTNISRFKVKTTRLSEDDIEKSNQKLNFYIKCDDVTYQYIIKSKTEHDSTQDISNVNVPVRND